MSKRMAIPMAIVVSIVIAGVGYYFLLTQHRTPQEQTGMELIPGWYYWSSPEDAAKNKYPFTDAEAKEMGLWKADSKQRDYLPQLLKNTSKVVIRGQIFQEKPFSYTITDPDEVSRFVAATRVTYMTENCMDNGFVDVDFYRNAKKIITINFNVWKGCTQFEWGDEMKAAYPPPRFILLVEKHAGRLIPEGGM